MKNLNFWYILEVICNVLGNLQYSTAKIECKRSFPLDFSSIPTHLQIWASVSDFGYIHVEPCVSGMSPSVFIGVVHFIRHFYVAWWRMILRFLSLGCIAWLLDIIMASGMIKYDIVRLAVEKYANAVMDRDEMPVN